MRTNLPTARRPPTGLHFLDAATLALAIPDMPLRPELLLDSAAALLREPSNAILPTKTIEQNFKMLETIGKTPINPIKVTNPIEKKKQIGNCKIAKLEKIAKLKN